jgi:hypothetical protein
MDKINLKKNKVERLAFPDFINYYIAIAIKIVEYWHKDRPTGNEVE